MIALWIPTDAEGKLKRAALMEHLAWLKTCGVHGILALGTTGEFPRMNLQERERVLADVIELAAPLPVVTNISSIRLDEVHALGKAAIRLGSVGAAIMCPWFFPMRPDDQLEFFLRAADGVSSPFYLYNFPEMVGNRISPDVIVRFSEKAPMVGFKQSGGELSYHAELIKLGRAHNFSVFTGADPLLSKLLADGVDGCVSGYGNFVPESLVNVYNSHFSGDTAQAQMHSARLQRVGVIADTLPVPMNVRSGIEARGIDPGALKTAVGASTLSDYSKGVSAFSDAFREWNLPPFKASPAIAAAVTAR